MDQQPRPWWAPDGQGFLAAAIVVMTFTALMVRMFHPTAQEDKMLDTMITILFSTCLVTVYQYTFGSSRGSSTKDDSQARMVEKLAASVVTPSTNNLPNPPVVTIKPWWDIMTDPERKAITDAAVNDPKVNVAMTTMMTGHASTDDLDYLVSKGLLTKDAADAIKIS